jgi:2-polyprenyl-3-methyl-5-hydroxy-6-metoxy-1,4-benzoquinol methylase
MRYFTQRTQPDVPPQAQESITFSFGENWQRFVEESFSEQKVKSAQDHMLRFLGRPDLKGKYFLDVGCGSGIHSLAALRAGAEHIVSFDLDPASVQTTKTLREMAGSPDQWQVLQGSVLDKTFLSSLEPADIVYSWGVLHHTGKMWEAILNTAGLTKGDGVFYTALYLTTPRSEYWLRVKQRYNRASRLEKRLMESWHLVRHTVVPDLIRLKNPLLTIRGHGRQRGMSYWTDARDWLGGYPYEDARIEEVLQFCRTRLDLELIDILPSPTLVEYLFARRGG